MHRMRYAREGVLKYNIMEGEPMKKHISKKERYEKLVAACEPFREAKRETIHTLAGIGRKHKLLRYPILVALLVFIFIYNVILYGCIQLKLREKFARGVALVMTVTLVFTGVNLTVFATTGKADDGANPKGVITAFRSLDETVAEQSLTVGAKENEINFPDTLIVTLEKERDEELRVDTASGEDAVPEAGSEPAENPVSDAGTAMETSIDVKWQLDIAASTSEIFDSSKEGSRYVYVPVISDKYTLAEGVSLPEITVTVESSSEDVSLPGNSITSESGTDGSIHNLTERIAALPDVQEYMEKEPDIDNWTEDEEAYEKAYTEWMEGLYAYAQEALSIQEELATLSEKEQAQIPEEALAKLTAWVEAAGLLSDSGVMLAVDGTAVPGVITSDQEWSEQTLTAGTYTINSGVTVTVSGRLTVSGNVTINGGGRLVRAGGYAQGASGSYGDKSALFYISGGTLTLNNITIDGNQVNAMGPAVYITSGTVNMEQGSVIQNNYNMNTGTTGVYAAGGIYCGGTLNINGGIIRNCKTTGEIDCNAYAHAGGGIYLKGICSMTSGSITGNSASNGGGIYLASNGAKLTVSGGTISGNKINSNGVGIGVYYSTHNSASSKLYIGGEGNIEDNIYLDNTSGALCPEITSSLRHKITLKCSSREEGKVLAKGSGYTLTSVDVSKISMADTTLFSRLDKANNQIILSTTEEAEAEWQESPGGAWQTGRFVTALEKVYSGGTIRLLKDIVFNEKVEVNKTVTITSKDAGNPYTITRMPTGEYGNITLTGSGNLTLTNIIYDGNGEWISGENAVKQSLIKVGDANNTETLLTLGSGCVICNGYKTGGSGVIAVYGKMIMNSGAVIENCEVTGTGGAVWVSSNGTFTMNGGTIKSCKAGGGGSAVSIDGACTLAGGSITGNTDTSDKSCAVYLRDSGSGKLTLSGISVSGNTYSVYNDGKSVSVTGNSTLSGNIYTTNAITASGTAVSGLTSTYTIKMSSVTNGTTVVTGSKDTQHYKLDDSEFGLIPASSGTSLIAGRIYTVAYNKNSGTIANESSYTSYTYGTGLTLPTPTRTGYIFGGWYENSGFTGSKVTSISTTATGNKTYYAKWTANTYTVTYNKNSGTIANESSYTSYTYGTGLTLPTPTRTGYTFGGWYENSGFTGSKVTSISTNATGNKTYYAKWTANTYTVTYNKNSGTIANESNYTSYTYETGLTLPTPTRTGYTFGGWYENSGFTGSKVTSISTSATGNKTYYAKWSSAGIAIDETSIPDAVFREYISGLEFDKNGDGYLSDEEIAAVNKISVANKNISDLKGIELFTELTTLDCHGNKLSTLDVSSNTKLTQLSCYNNQLSTLDVSSNTKLEKLYCYTNQISALDVGSNTALTTLHCYQNQLSTLDVSNNTELITLYCHNNKLTTLDVSGNTKLTTLYCQSNQLTALDVSDNIKLTTLYCSKNQLTSLDVSNTELKNFDCANNKYTVTACLLDFDALPEGFSVSKAGDWTNAKLTDDNKLLYLGGDGTAAVTYTYDCGNDKTATFTLRFPKHSCDKVDKKDATCDEDGNVEYYKCTKCDYKFSRVMPETEDDIMLADDIVIAATGHEYGDWSVTTKPTLPTKGEAERVCAKNSEHKETQELPALSDTSVWTKDNSKHVEPTEEQTGKDVYTSEYGEVEVTLPKKAHTHVWGGWSVTTKPTLIATGKAERVCAKNSEHKETQELPALSDTSVWTKDNSKHVEPTEEKMGKDVYTSEYGEVEVMLPKKEHIHTYSEEWKSDDTGHWKVCSRCGAYNTKQSHIYDNDKDADCNTCGYKRVISNDEQPTSPTKPPEQSQPTSPTKPPEQSQPTSPTKPPEQSQPTSPTNPPEQSEDKKEPESTETPQSSEQTSEAENDKVPEGDGKQTIPVSVDNGKLTISGESAATGNVVGMPAADTVLKLGTGAIIVTVVCAAQEYTAGVADTIAVANTVLTSEQFEHVNNGGTIEIRIDVKDISGKVPEQDKEVIEKGIEEYQKEVSGLTLGMYIDISMFVKIGDGDWDAVTETGEPIEVIIGIPEKLQEEGRVYYIIRAHDGVHTVMSDMDNETETITISTGMFSSYAIAYAEAEEAGADDGAKCGLCHICPTFLGICYFVWLVIIIVVMILVISLILWRKRKEENTLS